MNDGWMDACMHEGLNGRWMNDDTQANTEIAMIVSMAVMAVIPST